MVRVQCDDTEAFGRLYDRHAVRAFWVARSICRDTSQAEDAVQEGFLVVWRSRASFQSGLGSFQAWAMACIRNRAIDSVREEAARVRLRLAVENEEAPKQASASIADQVIARTQGDAMRTSLQQLPDPQAEVIRLAYFGGLSHSEIAETLQLPLGTVKGRMRLGMERLRSRLTSQRRPRG